MFAVIEMMVEVYELSLEDTDVFTARFENLTRSSADFDIELSNLFDFMFGDAITPAERELIDEEARKEDLNRMELDEAAPSTSVSASNPSDDADPEEIISQRAGHTNSDDEMQLARELGVPLIPQPLLNQYRDFQRRLGYEPYEATR